MTEPEPEIISHMRKWLTFAPEHASCFVPRASIVAILAAYDARRPAAYDEWVGVGMTDKSERP